MIYSDSYKQDINKVISCIPCIEKLKGSSILITGATGMIGSAVADLLFTLNEIGFGLKIILAGRSESRLKKRFECYVDNVDFTFLLFDANQIQDLKVQADYIIHAASNADPTMFVKEPVETITSNINGLNTLLKTLKNNTSGRLLFVSSSEVYGKKHDSRPYLEDDFGFVDILNPRACYPNAKRTSETLCTAYNQEYGIDTVIVRPGHIYGPTMTSTDSRASSQFPRDILEGKDIIMKSSGMQIRSYCYVLDCASAILTVLINGKKGEAYNISNKKSIITIKEMAETFAQIGNVQIFFDNPTNSERKGYNLMVNSSLDSKKIEALGWQALFNISDGATQCLNQLYYNERNSK